MCIQKLIIIVKIRKRLTPVIWLGNLQWYICRLNTDLGLLNECYFLIGTAICAIYSGFKGTKPGPSR